MTNWIVGGVLVLLTAFAVGYIVSSKKKGHKCIGCPGGGSCASCQAHCDQKK